MRAHRFQDLADAVQPESLDQKMMERDIEPVEAVEVAAFHGGALIGHVAVQPFDPVGAEPLGAGCHHLHLQSAPHHHPLPDIADADARDVGASLRFDHNEALEGEAVDGGGDR